MPVRHLTTADGPARMLRDVPADPCAVLLLGHGAGGGPDGYDLLALAQGLPEYRIGVLRFEQPWRTAGRKVAGPPATLDRAWARALTHARRSVPCVRLVVGGHSAGARCAARMFAPPARGVVALSFPLHPPGKPESSRADELRRVAGPRLVVQGATDPFGTPEEIRAAFGDTVTLVPVPGAGHSLAPPRGADPAAHTGRIVGAVAEFVAALI